jgi:hypothetical protein
VEPDDDEKAGGFDEVDSGISLDDARLWNEWGV